LTSLRRLHCRAFRGSAVPNPRNKGVVARSDVDRAWEKVHMSKKMYEAGVRPAEGTSTSVDTSNSTAEEITAYTIPLSGDPATLAQTLVTHLGPDAARKVRDALTRCLKPRKSSKLK
jgi:hypothetical protein